MVALWSSAILHAKLMSPGYWPAFQNNLTAPGVQGKRFLAPACHDWADAIGGPQVNNPDFFAYDFLKNLDRPPLMKDSLGDTAVEVALRQVKRAFTVRIIIEAWPVPL